MRFVEFEVQRRIKGTRVRILRARVHADDVPAGLTYGGQEFCARFELPAESIDAVMCHWTHASGLRSWTEVTDVGNVVHEVDVPTCQPGHGRYVTT